jgi:hypothetical protein
MEHMKQWQPVPNVQMHQPPPDMALEDEAEEDDPEERVSKAAADASVDHPAEFMDGRAGE